MSAPAIIVISSSDLIRRGITAILNDHAAFTCEAVATVSAAEEWVSATWTGIFLLDDELPPQQSLLDVLHSLQTRCPEAAIVIVSDCLSAYYVQRVLRAGASGFVYKGDHLLQTLAGGMRAVQEGHLFLSPKASGLPYESQQYESLTQTDIEVLRLCAAGLTTQEIASRLGLVAQSIYRSRGRLRNFLGVNNNEQVVDVARRQGLLKSYS